MKDIFKLVNLNKRLILASKSPRRSLLLKNLGFEFDVVTSNYKEPKIKTFEDYSLFVKNSAFFKAEDVYKRINYDALIISADTIVVLDNKILHKPKDEQGAFRILTKLSDNTHTVYTGICLFDKASGKFLTDYQETEVSFRKLDDDEINSYIATDSPMDKAGAYGIQDDFGAVFVSNIKGCYYNIVGLPLELLYRNMREFLKGL